MKDPLDVETLAAEVANGNFADARLNGRLERIIERIGAEPSRSFPQVFSSAELEGAYRFFSNVRVTPEEILAPHVGAVQRRCDAARRVLLVHDSSDFSFRVDGQRKDLGRARCSSQTFYGHFTLALSADGLRKPLGVVALTTWTRGPELYADKSGDDKERNRWLEQASKVSANLTPETYAISVMDREADNYALFAKLTKTGQHFIVRGYLDRWLELPVDGSKEKLSNVVASITTQIDRDASLTKRRPKRSPTKAKTHPERAARVATLSVGATAVLMLQTGYVPKGSARETIPINVVRVWEQDPPEGEPPVEWILYTNEPISTASEVLAVVDHYRARWTIEEYFKALKTGCSFERRQLQDYESTHEPPRDVCASRIPGATASNASSHRARCPSEYRAGRRRARSPSRARTTQTDALSNCTRSHARRRRTRRSHQVRPRPRLADLIPRLSRARCFNERMACCKIPLR